MRKAIAIDFDGCLCVDAYPAIGKPNWAVFNRAKAKQQAGAGLILWTCREGDLLQKAVTACEGWGLTFDAVNESLPDWIDEFGTRPRKVGATEYWDDKAVQTPIIQQTTNLPIPKQFQGVELIDKNAVLQALVKNGWLKMNALEDSAEMIAVQAIIYDAPAVTLPRDVPPADTPAIKWLSWENAEEWGTIYCPMLDMEVMTYCPNGAPAFDTYTAPFVDVDGEAGYYKYDQDEGCWVEDLHCIADYTEGMKLRL